MLGGFPGSALVIQLFRQLTKPMSERIVAYAVQHPKFRRRLLIVPGRIYQRLKYNLEQIRNGNIVVKTRERQAIVPIKDDEAVEIGSQLMIEMLIFAILVLLMTCDWIRSQLRTAELEEYRQRELEELMKRKAIARERLESLIRETELIRQEIRQLESQVPLDAIYELER